MKRGSILSLLLFALALLPALLPAQTDTLSADSAAAIITRLPVAPGRDTLVIVVEQQQKSQSPASVLTRSLTGESGEGNSGPPSLGELLSVGKIIWSIIVILIGYFVIRFLSRSLEFLAERRAASRSSIKRYGPVVQIFGWILIIYTVIGGIIHPPMETLIAVSASLGIAVGFASQDILKNIFAGMVILFDRPFMVGDKIEIGSFYGEVKTIGLRSTRIETPDDSLVTVPNADLMSSSVSNSNSGEENCQVVAEIYLPIDIDTEEVRKVATEAAQVSRFIYLNKPITVLFFNEVKERRSYYKMRLKAYVMDIRYEFAFKSDLTELTVRELLAAGLIRPDQLY